MTCILMTVVGLGGQRRCTAGWTSCYNIPSGLFLFKAHTVSAHVQLELTRTPYVFNSFICFQEQDGSALQLLSNVQKKNIYQSSPRATRRVISEFFFIILDYFKFDKIICL